MLCIAMKLASDPNNPTPGVNPSQLSVFLRKSRKFLILRDFLYLYTLQPCQSTLAVYKCVILAPCVVANRLCGRATRHASRLALHPESDEPNAQLIPERALRLKQVKYAPSALCGQLAQTIVGVGGYRVRSLFKQGQVIHGVGVKGGFYVAPR